MSGGELAEVRVRTKVFSDNELEEGSVIRRFRITADDGKSYAIQVNSEREVLTHASELGADMAEKLALERYERFDTARHEVTRLAADVVDITALEQTQRLLNVKGRGGKK